MLLKQQAIVNVQAKHTCKSLTASPENSFYLLLSNTWFGLLIAVLSRNNTNLKMYSTKVV